MTPTRWLLTACLATWLFWLGYCLVILELHGRLNVQHGNQAMRLARDWSSGK